MTNQNTVGKSSSVRVKIETNVIIKTEIIDYDGANENIPLADLNADSDEKLNIVQFHDKETRFMKLEAGSGKSGIHGRFLHNKSEIISIKTVAIDSDEINVHGSDKGNIVEFHERENYFIKPELNSDSSGDEERNLQSERPEKEKCVLCPKCNKAFSFKRHLTRHISSVHMKLKKYVCQECNHASSEQGSLNKHIDAVHLKLKKYICQECKHAFSQQGCLKNHVDTVHLKLKKYVCQDCSYAFSLQSSLKKHVDTVHLKLKKFICQECCHAFSRQSSLKAHVDAVHIKLKKFSCAECDRSFAAKRYLKTHIGRVHNKM